MNFTLFTGFVAAFLHVVSGPDHLAAVTPLAIESRRKVWKIGLFWGIGHLAGMLVIGALFYSFKELIPVELISESSEQIVGIVLILVGVWALFRVFNKRINEKQPHIHGGEKPFVHEHNTEDGVLIHKHVHSKKERQNIGSSFGIGILHGLAGVAHFLLLLPVLGFENKADGILYIIGFAMGTVLAMTIYTLLLGWIATYSKVEKGSSVFRTLRIIGGMFALLVGFYWLYLSV